MCARTHLHAAVAGGRVFRLVLQGIQGIQGGQAGIGIKSQDRTEVSNRQASKGCARARVCVCVCVCVVPKFHVSGLAVTTSMWQPTNDMMPPSVTPGYSTMMLPRPCDDVTHTHTHTHSDYLTMAIMLLGHTGVAGCFAICTPVLLTHMNEYGIINNSGNLVMHVCAQRPGCVCACVRVCVFVCVCVCVSPQQRICAEYAVARHSPDCVVPVCLGHDAQLQTYTHTHTHTQP